MAEEDGKQVLLLFIVAFVTILAILAAVGVYAISAVNKDVVSGVNVINPSGNTTALVVYQEGLTAYPKNISYAFANGLAERGGEWRSPPPPQAPSNLSKYSLLVLGTPTYGGL